MTNGSEKTQQIFIEHLNRIYCAKAHLVERLHEIIDEPQFIKIKEIIVNIVTRSEKQIRALDEIYAHLQIRHSFEKCNGLISFLEDSFASFRHVVDELYLSHLLIRCYLQHVENIVSVSLDLLQILAYKLDQPEIETILTKTFNENDRALYDQLTSEI